MHKHAQYIHVHVGKLKFVLYATEKVYNCVICTHCVGLFPSRLLFPRMVGNVCQVSIKPCILELTFLGIKSIQC